MIVPRFAVEVYLDCQEWSIGNRPEPKMENYESARELNHEWHAPWSEKRAQIRDEPQRTWRGLRPQPTRPHRLSVGGESDFALHRKQRATNAPAEFISVERMILH